MDHDDRRDSEFVKLNCASEDQTSSSQTFDKKTLAQLRDVFNECIEIDKTSGDIIIHLSSFFTCFDSQYNREMTVLKMITKSKNLHILLDHPLPRLVLDLKWNKAAKMFYLNLFILSVFIVSMIGYMLYYHSIVSDELRETSVGLSFWKLMCKIVIVYLIIRELCQFYLNFRGHLSLLNLMELILIYYGFEAFFLPAKIDIQSRKVRNVILILLCTCELLHILSKIPLASLSTYIAILKRVFKTFMKVLILYSIVIVAFATSFHIIFVSNDVNLDEEDHFTHFQTLPLALLRTIVMMTGEFDADDLQLNSIHTGLIFLLFMIVCTIILFNLLNALAISDTQEIIDEGKCFERIQRVEILYFYEKCVRNLINREKILFFPIFKCFKKFEKFLGFEIYNQFFNIWPPSLTNSGTVIIRTSNKFQILVLDASDKEMEIPNPNFVFKKFLPSFPKTVREFKDTICEYETTSDEIVDAISEIMKAKSKESNELILTQLLSEIKLLKDQFRAIETDNKLIVEMCKDIAKKRYYKAHS